MEPRIDHRKASPGAMKAMFGLEHYVHQCGLPENLLHLAKLRVSQINGCAYCIDMLELFGGKALSLHSF